MSITAYENIEDINKNLTDEGQYITAKDLFVILQGKNPVTNFGTCEFDVLELAVYDINNNLLPNIFGNDIEYIKFGDINQYLTPDGKNIQLEKLLNSVGFKNGIFKVSLAFVRKRAGDETEYRRFWIQEIAASRTEIRVVPLSTNDASLTTLNSSDLESLQRQDTDFETIKKSVTDQLATINEAIFAKTIEDYFKNRYASLGENIFFDILKTDFLLTKDFKAFVQEIITNYKTSVEYYFLNKNYDINASGFGQVNPNGIFSANNCTLYNSSDITADLNNILLSCINWSVNKYLATRTTAISAGSQTQSPYTSTFVNSTQTLSTNGVTVQTITQPILTSGNYTIAFNDAAVAPVVQTTTVAATTTISPTTQPPIQTTTTTAQTTQPPLVASYYFYTITSCTTGTGIVIGPYTTNTFGVNNVLQNTSTSEYYTVNSVLQYSSTNANIPTGYTADTNINKYAYTQYTSCPGSGGGTGGGGIVNTTTYYYYSLTLCSGVQTGEVWSMRYSQNVFSVGAIVIDSLGTYYTVKAVSNVLPNGATQVGINPTNLTTCPSYIPTAPGGGNYVWFKLRPCDKINQANYTTGAYDVYSVAQSPTTYMNGERVLGGTNYYYTIVGSAYTIDPDPGLTTGAKVQISRLGIDPNTNLPYMGCPNGGTLTTTTTVNPIIVNVGPVNCDPATFTGTFTATFSGGNKIYSYIAIGTSVQNAMQKVNSTAVGDRIVLNGASSYTFTKIASGLTYYVAVMDNSGASGASSLGTTVNCGSSSNTTITQYNWYKLQLCNTTTVAYSANYPVNSFFPGQMVTDISGNLYTVITAYGVDPNALGVKIAIGKTTYTSCPATTNTGGGVVNTTTLNSAGIPIQTLN